MRTTQLWLYFILFAWTSLALASPQKITLPTGSLVTLDIFDSSQQSFSDIRLTDTQSKNEITLCWKIPKGQYLYRDKIDVALKDAENAKIGEILFPKAQEHPVFPKDKVYAHKLFLRIHLTGEINPASKLEVHYQGCDESLCHLPQVKEISIDSSVLPLEEPRFNWLGILVLLGIGLLLAFTPCVLPMVPIISAIVIGKNHSKTYSFMLALSYVLGMSVMYAILGILISSIGLSFQLFFQQAWVIILTSLLFVALACSMFGFFQIQLPNALSSRLGQAQSNIKTGGIFGSFLMGIIASLVLSPCTSAPLIGILSTIAQTGDVVYGGIALFALGIGMGIPLILIALGLKRFVPKSGMWMEEIKVLFGIAMLVLAIYLASRIVDNFSFVISAYTMLGLGYLIYIIYGSSLLAFLHRQTKHVLAALFAFLSLTLIVISFSNFTIHSSCRAQAGSDLTTVCNIRDLNSEITKAFETHEYVIVDYFAQWCVNCVQLEAILTNTSMQNYFKDNNIKVIKVDATKYNERSTALLKKANILGLPTLILIDQQRHELARISGMMPETELTSRLNGHLK